MNYFSSKCRLTTEEGILKFHIITHLHNKTNKEVESSNSDEQHFELHIREVVHLKFLADERPRIHHQPSHHGKEDKQ